MKLKSNIPCFAVRGLTDKQTELWGCTDRALCGPLCSNDCDEWKITTHLTHGLNVSVVTLMSQDCLTPSTWRMLGSISYLVKISFGVSQEGDAVSFSDTDSHSSETGDGGLPHSFSFHRVPARHGTGGVVRATRICLQGILNTWQDGKFGYYINTIITDAI